MSQDLLANLSGLYYQQLSSKLNNPVGFQVATGSVAVQDQLTFDNIAGAIPIESLNNSFSGNPVNSFDGNYGNIINGLVTPSYVANALGTQYDQSWESYKAANVNSIVFSPISAYVDSLQGLMRKWGATNGVPTGVVQSGCTALQQESDSSVAVAVNLWGSNNGNPYGYLPSSAGIPTKFNNPSPCSFSISSIQNSANLSNTWAKGEFGILADIFEFGNETSYSQESQKFVGSGFTLNFSCRQVSIDVSPITAGQSFPIAGTTYGAWYSPAALQRAYAAPNDATVWVRAADWNKYFGDSGTFNRVVTEIFLADTINLTMTSTATFSSTEVTNLETAAEGGIWPFFVANVSGGYNSTVTHNDDNTITVTTTSPAGIPILLGVATATVQQLLNGGE